MINKSPRLIAECADVADVIQSVNFARENDIILSIRSAATTQVDWVFVTMAWSLIFPVLSTLL